jgi:RNA 2',3'-cyclic 3'-phosphodiesterase
MSPPEDERPSRRLFVAVELPAAWVDAAARMQAALRATAPRLRYPRPDGIHLTLKFIGETSSDRGAAIEATLAGVPLPSPPPRLELGLPGHFGGSRAPRVVWVGLRGDLGPLGTLQRAVDRALAPLGIAAETRPFSPHLTLARVPDGLAAAERAAIVPALARLPVPDGSGPLLVRSFTLFESRLGAGGARYLPVRVYPA